MSISRKRAQEYAEKLLETPRRDIPVTLRRGKGGVALLYKGRALTKCHASRVGARQAVCVAGALGVDLPGRGQSVSAVVSSGVLYRAIAVSSLDLRKPEAFILLERLLEEAAMQRGMAGPVREV